MSDVTTVEPNDLSQQDLHNLLLTAVAPRPICLASTIDQHDNINLSPFSFFNVFSSNPPVMIFSPARSGRDNTIKHTLQNIYDVKEVVINIVNHSLVEQMSLSSTAYDKGVNEFIKAGFTQIPSDKIRPPRVGESPVSFECKVNQVLALGDQGGAGNLVIAEVIVIHMNKDYLNTSGQLETQKLDLVARMGGSWYCHANERALFEIPKPLSTKGIGIDELPEHIRQSTILTGNDLGRLGNQEELPDTEAIAARRRLREVNDILESSSSELEKEQKIHSLAKGVLESGHTYDALCILMTLKA